ncbi:MAG: hypothetical protein DRR16_25585 [Candidatus Parabeggiatoa sp. nov. 3]|nr:MAG: hypothetical protein DRQ99_22715 [Gammaproteobacteria bacterium]RKZ79499.1 MAG: hypothetical protein DRR16_25585 [Gammaproteobacteria bacterium]
MNDKIDPAIWAHSRWKVHLKEAIETGQSDFNVETVRNPHACAFGQWLDSKEGKTLSHYSEIVELHQNFHKEAAQILSLALIGQKDEAASKIQLGSEFSHMTARLVNTLADIGKKNGDQ